MYIYICIYIYMYMYTYTVQYTCICVCVCTHPISKVFKNLRFPQGTRQPVPQPDLTLAGNSAVHGLRCEPGGPEGTQRQRWSWLMLLD